MGALDVYMRDIGNKERIYKANWARPYATAYSTAYNNFKDTLNSQQQFEAMVTGLLISAVTAGVAGGLGAMFAKTGGATGFFNRALDFASRRNMERSFYTMVSVQGSQAGAFIAGGGWAAIKTLGGGVLTQATQGLVTQPVMTENATRPDIFRDSLLMYVERAIAVGHIAGAALQDDGDLNETYRDELAQELIRAPLFQNAPNTNIIPQHAAEDIELSMFMKLVMDSDYTQYSMDTGGRSDNSLRIDPTIPINMSANAVNYPRTIRTNYGGFWSSTHSTTTVGYENPGHIVINRINELYRSRINSREDFLNRAYDRGIIQKAERVFRQVNENNNRILIMRQ